MTALAQQLPFDDEPESPPLLRTLYIAAHGTKLGLRGERFIVEPLDGKPRHVPFIQVDHILLFGNIIVSPNVVHFCAEQNIPILYLSVQGKFRALMGGFDLAHTEHHCHQILFSQDSEQWLPFARECVRAKIHNSAVVLARYRRYHHHEEPSGRETFTRLAHKAGRSETLNRLLGYEGVAARYYFDALQALLPPEWSFSGRQRHPPVDPVNALLSLGYSLLYGNLMSLLLAEGLHPGFGLLHQIRNGHAALASDLMEEFRAAIVDSLVLACVLNGKITLDDFQTETDSPCRLQSEGMKRFLALFEHKMNSTLTHPVTGITLDYRRCILQQVKQFKALLYGSSSYQAFKIH